MNGKQSGQLEESRENQREKEIAVEKILTSQMQWQETIDAISDYIFVIDRDRKVRRMNASFSRRFNTHPRELVGQRINELFSLEVPHEKCALDRAIATRAPVLDEIVLGDETYMISVFPSSFGDEEVYVCIMKDVTEMKRLRDKIYHSYKLVSIGQLVSGVAHEINNPLTGILGFAELIAMKTGDETVRTEAVKIRTAAERCRKIVESLLCFSRQQKPCRSLEYVNDIIEKALELRAYWLRVHNIEVVRRYGEIPMAFLDIQQIQQAIVNILVNAEQAMADRPVQGRLVIETAYDAETRRITVRITDNGPGIPRDFIDRIFDPFFTTKPVDQGTGLGLSITYGIITEHGGTIRAENEEGGGASFIMVIPANQKLPEP